jgi:hypothetical protein
MRILKNSLKALALMAPCVIVFYTGYRIVDRKSPILPFLNENYSIIFGTALMAIAVCSIYFILKNDFCIKKKDNQKSDFIYLDEHKINTSRIV